MATAAAAAAAAGAELIIFFITSSQRRLGEIERLAGASITRDTVGAGAGTVCAPLVVPSLEFSSRSPFPGIVVVFLSHPFAGIVVVFLSHLFAGIVVVFLSHRQHRAYARPQASVRISAFE